MNACNLIAYDGTEREVADVFGSIVKNLNL